MNCASTQIGDIVIWKFQELSNQDEIVYALIDCDFYKEMGNGWYCLFDCLFSCCYYQSINHLMRTYCSQIDIEIDMLPK